MGGGGEVLLFSTYPRFPQGNLPGQNWSNKQIWISLGESVNKSCFPTMLDQKAIARRWLLYGAIF